MQQGTTQVSSGNIAPTVGPQRDVKEVILLGAVVLFLGGLLAATWLYNQPGDQGEVTPVMSRIENANVPNLLKTPLSQAKSKLQPSTPPRSQLRLSLPRTLSMPIFISKSTGRA